MNPVLLHIDCAGRRRGADNCSCCLTSSEKTDPYLMDLNILSKKGGKYYIIIFMYKNQKWSRTGEFGSEAGSRKNPSILEMGPNGFSISN